MQWSTCILRRSILIWLIRIFVYNVANLTFRSSAFVSGVWWMGCWDPDGCCIDGEPYWLHCFGGVGNIVAAFGDWSGCTCIDIVDSITWFVPRWSELVDRSSTLTYCPFRTGGIFPKIFFCSISNYILFRNIYHVKSLTLNALNPFVYCFFFTCTVFISNPFTTQFQALNCFFMKRQIIPKKSPMKKYVYDLFVTVYCPFQKTLFLLWFWIIFPFFRRNTQIFL